jgi:hypothetical protein
MNHHELLVVLPQKNLTNLRAWLGKARAHAAAAGIDPDSLLAARLAPDQFALVRQVQSACDAAKGNAARLAGQAPPSHPDVEASLAELEARVDAVLGYLGTFTAADFDGADDQKIALGWMRGKHVVGKDYLEQFGLPNFFFHLNHCYAILRHVGVPLGKMDYIGGLALRD